MKKIVSLILGIFVFAALKGQTKDSVYFQAFYKLDYVKDLLEPQRIRKDEMLLSVGNSIVSFYSYKNFVVDSLREADPEEYMPSIVNDGNMNYVLPAKTMVYSSFNKVSYFFDKRTDELSCLCKIQDNKYGYKGKYLKPEWKISRDTASVLGYLCQKATSVYGGRKWTVWFAAGIPIPEGPWKLKGLPGLILKAEDDTRSYVFECTNFSRLKKKKPVVKDDEGCKMLSEKEFTDKYVRDFNEPFAESEIKFTFGTKPLVRQLNPFEKGGI